MAGYGTGGYGLGGYGVGEVSPTPTEGPAVLTVTARARATVGTTSIEATALVTIAVRTGGPT
jgi:hypothetical protein